MNILLRGKKGIISSSKIGRYSWRYEQTYFEDEYCVDVSDDADIVSSSSGSFSDSDEMSGSIQGPLTGLGISAANDEDAAAVEL